MNASDTGPAAPEVLPDRVRRDERRALRRLVGMLVFAVAAVSVIGEIPSLHGVASAISRMNPIAITGAVALEIASCASFVIIFRRFFVGLATAGGRAVRRIPPRSSVPPAAGTGVRRISGASYLLHARTVVLGWWS